MITMSKATQHAPTVTQMLILDWLRASTALQLLADAAAREALAAHLLLD